MDGLADTRVLGGTLLEALRRVGVPPMHLHGFHFDVESLGDGLRDNPVAAANRHPVVTQLPGTGATMTMTWIPEREGHWRFHCHIMHHAIAC